MIAANEKMSDGDENNRTERRGRKRIPEPSAENPQLDENPAADEGANDSQDDIRNAAKPAAARDFSSEPTGDQANKDPIEETTRKH